MKINTRTVWQMTDNGDYVLLEQESYEYNGPIIQAFGGRSTTVGPQTTQEIETTTVGLQDIEGIGVAAGGDVEFTQTVTDQGAIQGAFDFATDIAGQGFQAAQQAVETSRQAIGLVGTGGQSEISGQVFKFGGLAVAAIAAIFIIPRLFGRN